MSGIVHNFRGRRALIVHRDDVNRRRLDTDLRRLGLMVDAADPEREDIAPRLCDGERDIVFFDADHGACNLLPAPVPDLPLVALVGVEAPSRLSRVVRLRTCAVLTKPVGSTGIFTALFVAFNEHARRVREAREVEALQARLRGRRLVMKAVLKVMREHGVDDDKAFHLLRRESMRQRLALEEFCREMLLETDESAATTGECSSA